MIKSKFAWAVVALFPLTLLNVPITADAAQGPRITTTLRVSRDCLVTVIAHWSGWSSVTKVQNNFSDGSYGRTDYEYTATSRGSLKTVSQGTPTTNLNQISADSWVWSGGYSNSSDGAITDANCVGPYTLVSSTLH